MLPTLSQIVSEVIEADNWKSKSYAESQRVLQPILDAGDHDIVHDVVGYLLDLLHDHEETREFMRVLRGTCDVIRKRNEVEATEHDEA